MTRLLTAARLAAATLGAVLLATSVPAVAYPYFRTSSGTDTCGACHVAPSGGGPLTAWGRGEAGSTLARGGDGAFLHGLVELPGWLDLGGDLRLAALVNDVGNRGGAEVAVFPMQAEVSAHAARGAWHLVANAGLLGAVRRDGAMAAAAPAPAVPWLVSSAHYVLWMPDERGAYARAGKFATPVGLRLADHTAYVRRQPGLGLYEEPYAVSGGHIGAQWDVHVTAFVSDPWRGPPGRDVGGALLTERRAGPWVAAASAQVIEGEDDRRVRLGAATSWWSEAASLQAVVALDGGWQRLPTLARRQVTGHAGLAWLPIRGVVVGGTYEYDDVDVGRAGDGRHGLGLWSTFMPVAHVELGLAGRYQWIGPDGRAAMALLQLHYFL